MNDEARRLRLLARLSPGVLHDVRNLLNAAGLHAQALSERLSRLLAKTEMELAARHLAAIDQRVRQIDALVTGFAGLAAQRSSRTDAATALAVAATLCAHDARKRRVTIGIEVPAGVWGEGERAPLEPFFAELLLEAVDRCADGTVTASLSVGETLTLQAAGLLEPGVEWKKRAAEAGLSLSGEAGAWRLRRIATS